MTMIRTYSKLTAGDFAPLVLDVLATEARMPTNPILGEIAEAVRKILNATAGSEGKAPDLHVLGRYDGTGQPMVVRYVAEALVWAKRSNFVLLVGAKYQITPEGRDFVATPSFASIRERGAARILAKIEEMGAAPAVLAAPEPDPVVSVPEPVMVAAPAVAASEPEPVVEAPMFFVAAPAPVVSVPEPVVVAPEPVPFPRPVISNMIPKGQERAYEAMMAEAECFGTFAKDDAQCGRCMLRPLCALAARGVSRGGRGVAHGK